MNNLHCLKRAKTQNMNVEINDSPRKQDGSVPSIAAKMEGVEGPTSSPQGVDGERSGTRHPWVAQSMCGCKEAANLCHDTRRKGQENWAERWAADLKDNIQQFCSINIRFTWLFQKDSAPSKLKVDLKSTINRKLVILFGFYTTTEQRWSESNSLPWSRSLAQRRQLCLMRRVYLLYC